ncbi:putative DBH-like monooxygenase protein 2 isoform X2 [Ambystoma mexicanum]|uniref:putative DBH-like monooxygenase protein 2 isoform X2 n=1 Tax=Ambystoma mexicanum TaxID=8296 RepID=UPI0037E7E4AE
MTHQILLFFCVLPLAVAQLADLRFSQVLDTKGSVLLRWDFNTNLEEITFELQVKTTGWVGFGLSPGGGMAGADIVIGGINPSMNPTTYFADYHGVGEVMPVRDSIQNYVLLSSSENGTFTTLRFSRKFKPCDPNDVPITADTMRIIAAYGTTDTIGYHGSNRFQKSLQLLPATLTSTAAPPDPSYTYDLKMTNFPVPPTSTTYGCAYLPLPSVTAKNHIYKFEANIQGGNEDLVHHILVYSCPNSTNINFSPGECYTGNSPFYSCFQVLVGWAVGGGPFTLPSNAGISLGTSIDPRYIRLEIHYNNPGMQSGRMDSSGIRIYYTPVVRQHDVGVLTTGLETMKYFIPPHAESFKVYSVCNTSLFNQVDGQVVQDMQVFASILHTHLTGRAVQVVQYRNEEQIGFLGRDMAYDFNLQETRYLPSIMPIKMGDRLQVECTYNTTTRTSITYSGLSTMEEMCLGFLYYYPRNNIAQCLSFPDETALALSYNISEPSIFSFFRNVSWSEQNIQLLQKRTKEAVQQSWVIPFNGNSSATSAYVRNITNPPVTPCTNSVPVGPSAMPTASVPVAPSTMPATTKNGAKPQSTTATKAVLTVLSLIALFMGN